MTDTNLSPNLTPYLVAATSGEVLNYGLIAAAQLAQTPGAVAISPAQYATLLAGGRYFWGQNTLTLVPPEPPLTQAQIAACASIDRAAENCRLTFVTPGSGQAMVYMLKAQEAQAFLAKYPTEEAVAAAQAVLAESDWPFLSAEAGITAPDMFSVAELVTRLQSDWIETAATIEKLRLNGKMLVSKATDLAAINAAMVIAWPVAPAS
jgi:hypothetical protein